MGTQIFQILETHFIILGARKVTWRKFHIEDPQMLGARVLNPAPGICAPLYNSMYVSELFIVGPVCRSMPHLRGPQSSDPNCRYVCHQLSDDQGWYQASAAMEVISGLFWDFTQRRVVISYRCFGTTYRSLLEGSRRWTKRHWDRFFSA
jgi:hypothetical protein